MQRAILCCRYEWQIDLRLGHLRQFDFGFLSGFFQTLNRHAILAQVHTVGGFELGNQPIHDTLVPIIAAEVSVSVRALYFKDSVTNFQHAHVKCAATQVKHEHGFFLRPFVEAISQRGSCWFVDNAQHFETSNLAGFLGCRALGIIEIGRNSDDCLSHGVTEVRLGIPLQFHERAGANFLRGVLLAINIF